MRRRGFVLWFLVSVLSVPAYGQVFKYLGYGDSITEGFNDNPACLGCANPLVCGYPSRLSTGLGCTGVNCSVVNHGLSGEKTINGITRLNNVVFAGDPDWDVMVLMHGSNDLFATPPVPEETVRDNLKRMAYDAAELGVETLHASIIWFHPWGNHGHSRADEIENLRDLIAAMSTAENRTFADAWNLLCPVGGDIHGHPWAVTGQGCFNQHYCEDNPNGADQDAMWTLGHPNPSGFDMISDLFEASITAVAAPGVPLATAPLGGIGDTTPTLTWTKETPDRASWYEVEVETDLGAAVFDGWFPEADVTAVPPDPLIPGVCSGTTCSVTLTAPLAAGDYVWRVRGRNPQGRGAFTADAAFKLYTTPPPAVTVLTLPAGNNCVATPFAPTYTWDEVADATEYRLVVENGGTVIDQVFSASAICGGGTCSAVPAPLAHGSYTWKIQAQNPAGSAAFSASLAFDLTQSPLATPTGNYPVGSILKTTPATPTYRWSEVLGATDYTLGGTIPATNAAGFTCSAGSCSVKPAIPDLALGAYTWTVTPSNSCGSGSASAPVAFDVVACSNPGDLTLENDTVAGIESEDACGTVEAGDLGAGDYVVGPSGNLTIQAGVAVEFHDGFSVEAGGTLTVIVDQ